MPLTITNTLDRLGHYTLRICDTVGSFVLFLKGACIHLVTTSIDTKKLIQQIDQIGIASINIVVLTGTFTGMVFALQSYIGFSRMGGEQFIGTVVALGMARELGPVLTGLMVTGRAGSAMAAELGTMRISEQIDALWTLRINTFSYLIVPRILASIIVLPCLSLFATCCGILGGYFVVVYALNLSAEQYISSITQFVTLADVFGGLTKASVFGLLLSWAGCFKGYTASGGARGVGKATTQAVVLGSILILMINYVLTKVL